MIYSLRSTATEVFRISTLFESADAVSPTDPQNPNRLPQMRVENNLVPDSEDWAGGDNFQNPDTRPILSSSNTRFRTG